MGEEGRWEWRQQRWGRRSDAVVREEMRGVGEWEGGVVIGGVAGSGRRRRGREEDEKESEERERRVRECRGMV